MRSITYKEFNTYPCRVSEASKGVVKGGGGGVVVDPRVGDISIGKLSNAGGGGGGVGAVKGRWWRWRLLGPLCVCLGEMVNKL